MSIVVSFGCVRLCYSAQEKSPAEDIRRMCLVRLGEDDDDYWNGECAAIKPLIRLLPAPECSDCRIIMWSFATATAAKSHTKSFLRQLIKSATKKIINILQNGISAKVFITRLHTVTIRAPRPPPTPIIEGSISQRPLLRLLQLLILLPTHATWWASSFRPAFKLSILCRLLAILLSFDVSMLPAKFQSSLVGKRVIWSVRQTVSHIKG